MATTKTPRQARLNILQSFKDYWDASPYASVPVVYDNVNYKTDGSEYVGVGVAHNGGTIASLGNEQYRRTGVLVVNMNVPEGNGQARIDALAEAVLEWIETFNVAGIRLRDPGYNEIGSFGGYWQANVSAGFEYDAIRT